MELSERVEKLEKEIIYMKDEFRKLKKVIENKKETDVNINLVDNYMIKLVYTGVYSKINNDKKELKIGFPKNRRKLAEQISVGQKMFIYVTSPVKKIIGLMKVISKMEETMEQNTQWPYLIKLEWEIGPKQGLEFKELGLDIRPRIGDTLYSISEEKAKVIINNLKSQEDLSKEMISFLAREYGE